MRVKVNQQGALIPKELLSNVAEVDIRRDQDVLIVIPIFSNDPLFEFGTQPILSDVNDASVAHDRYLYGEA